MAERQNECYYKSLNFYKKLPLDHMIIHEGKTYKVNNLVKMLFQQQLKTSLSARELKKNLTYDGNSIEYWKSR
jgi:hypothetical protein